MEITRTQFNQAFGTLPYEIRKFISGMELIDIVEAIGYKYHLHVDIIGALNREVTNMLLGITNPSQFVGELRSAGVPANVTGPIVQELNDMIFLPLQRRIREAPPEEDADEEVDPAVPEAAPAVKPFVPPTGTPPFPPQSVSAPVTPPAATPSVLKMAPFVPPAGFAPSVPEFVPSSTPPTPPPAPQAFIPIPQSTPQQETQEYIRTMNADAQSVQQHQAPKMKPFVPPTEQPQIRPESYIPPAQPQPAAPASAPQVYAAPEQHVAPAPAFVPPPAPPAPQPYTPTSDFTPSTPPPAPAPTLRPRVMLTPSTAPSFSAPSNNRDDLRKLVKEYSADPYREPIDQTK